MQLHERDLQLQRAVASNVLFMEGLSLERLTRPVKAPRVKPVVEGALLGADDAAAYLHVSKSHWKEHVRPELAYVKIGRSVRFTREELDRWLDTHKHGSSAGPRAVGATSSSVSGMLANVSRSQRAEAILARLRQKRPASTRR